MRQSFFKPKDHQFLKESSLDIPKFSRQVSGLTDPCTSISVGTLENEPEVEPFAKLEVQEIAIVLGAKNISVIGTGYVGLPLCVLLKEFGHNVTGFDVCKDKVASHNQGTSTVEDVENHELEGIDFTHVPSDIADNDVYVICVPTPVTENKMPDLRFVDAVKKTLMAHATPGALIILESTVGVGDTRRVFQDMVDAGFLVAHSPERIDPGRKFPALADIPKVVGGVTPKSTQVAAAFYSTVFTQVVPVKDSNHSEAVKLLENSYRAVNISFANEFADFCDSVNLSAKTVVDAAATKPYGFSPFRSWIGVGGHCIPVDPHFLLGSNENFDWQILSSSMEAMHRRPRMLAEAAIRRTSPNKVLVCGVSYKPNISDTRDAPQIDFVRTLKSHGVSVDFHDPLVEQFEGLVRVPDLEDLALLESYDCIYIMHKHNINNDELEVLRSLSNVEYFC